jgi:uncharacterized membrane protein YagU involved in acid resistance|tara:strand:- start:156 stop:695 length:540 start_codon:yes stop_codon:yes gene_type:complete
MKKYFQFNGTINGTSYLLRTLFSIVLSIPFFIVSIAFVTIVGLELLDSVGIDISKIQETGTFDQIELEEKIEEKFKDNPEELVSLFKNAFTPFWIFGFILTIIPVIWFGIATYYKRVSALFYENRLNVFFGLLVFEIAADFIVIKFDNWLDPVFMIGTLLIFLFMLIKDSGIQPEDHEG